MSEQVYEQLTLFPVDSPANRSALPGNEEARKMTVSSGQKCSELSRKSGPLGSLVRMCLVSSVWHSTRCYLTWEPKGTKHNALLFRLAVSMPRTEETGPVLWPTICADGYGSTGHRKLLQKMVDKGMITQEEQRRMVRGHGGKINPEFAEWLMGYTKTFTQLLPTPRMSDYKTASNKRFYGGVLQTSVRRTFGMHSAWENWPPEPGVDRVVDGVPNRVDRIKCLGNAVVPQQFYPFFAAIAKIEEEENESE